MALVDFNGLVFLHNLVYSDAGIITNASDRVRKYDSNDYKRFIVRDFEHHRVFVDIEDFMKHVLHVPDNWKTEWAPAIKKIKNDRSFRSEFKGYREQCNAFGSQEKEFYLQLVDTLNTILDVARKSSIKLETPQRYIVNDPKRLHFGVLNEANLTPDVISLHENLHCNLQKDEIEKRRRDGTPLTWASPLQVLEVKHFDTALVDGSHMPRLKMNGKDPKTSHAGPPTKCRYKPLPVQTTSKPPKRALDGSSRPSRKAQKQGPKSTPNRTSVQSEEEEPYPSEELPRTKETGRQKEVYIQIGKYLFEQLSIPAFRSHTTVGLVDRDRIQLYHANRSVILVSSAINFGSTDKADGLDKLIAIVIAFSRLSLRDGGILHNLDNGNLFQDNEKLPMTRINTQLGVLRVQENELELKKDGKTLTLQYHEVASHEPSLIGRSTAVLHATSSEWQDKDLVVKISWPGADRVSEAKFLKRAIEKAKCTPNEWAVNHLPDHLFDLDVDFDSESTHGKVARMFKRAEFVESEYKYERRALRIIVQGCLYPLNTLTDVKEIAQVLLDVACIHRWLYEKVGILHCDLSLKNIMYRKINGKVYGVLNDFDLSSWTASLTSDYTRTSQQRTGTPPYMAAGLLMGTDTLHLYRHDVESLFYIMLVLASHHEIQQDGVRTRRGLETLPFEEWFDQPSYKTLGSLKQSFLMMLPPLDLSPTFEDFRDWLQELRFSLHKGILSECQYKGKVTRQEEGHGAGPSRVIPPDEEILGGSICYSALISPARNLKGKLEGLIVRYESES
ncbi:hypothetical protein BJ322DRAFT_1112555 [Thelephora terrestris]|uniref:Protein kinase domain-containing protein n=1 Tax=Thelephora terrestris TaxID=56493 RepID=A0A9P6H881_9AGAM|nr:hypothetical protein BJ322DRAFT_1112555 [Thelephora terrestris]